MTDMPPTPPEGTPGVPSSGPVSPNPGMPIDYSPPAAAGMPYVGPPPSQDEKTMAMLAHLLGVLGFLGPLIIWLIKKDQSPFVNDQGKEALNFHLVMLIGIIIGVATAAFCVGLIILPAVWIVSVIFSILGAMKAKEGLAYRYPFTIRFIK